MDKPGINPYIPIMIGVISVALSAVFVKLATADAGVIAFYRMFFSVLLLLPVFLFKYRWEVKLLSKRDWINTTFAGVFLAFHFIFFIVLNTQTVGTLIPFILHY